MAETATKVVVKEGERPLGSIGGGIAATEKLANPGDKDYDSKMAELWGGPPPQHFDAALEHWSAAYGDGAGKLALVTGGTGGVGFYVVKMLAGPYDEVAVRAKLDGLIAAEPVLMLSFVR